METFIARIKTVLLLLVVSAVLATDSNPAISSQKLQTNLLAIKNR
jgi:hypothetical protein